MFIPFVYPKYLPISSASHYSLCLIRFFTTGLIKIAWVSDECKYTLSVKTMSALSDLTDENLGLRKIKADENLGPYSTSSSNE